MIKHTILAAALALALSPAAAQTRTDSGGTVIPGVDDVSNATKAPQYCQVTVTTTAASLASLLSTASCAAVPSWATLAFVTPETNAEPAIRYRADGMAPTGSVGEPVLGWQTWPAQGASALSNLSLISATGANVPVDVEIRG